MATSRPPMRSRFRSGNSAKRQPGFLPPSAGPIATFPGPASLAGGIGWFEKGFESTRTPSGRMSPGSSSHWNGLCNASRRPPIDSTSLGSNASYAGSRVATGTPSAPSALRRRGRGPAVVRTPDRRQQSQNLLPGLAIPPNDSPNATGVDHHSIRRRPTARPLEQQAVRLDLHPMGREDPGLGRFPALDLHRHESPVRLAPNLVGPADEAERVGREVLPRESTVVGGDEGARPPREEDPRESPPPRHHECDSDHGRDRPQLGRDRQESAPSRSQPSTAAPTSRASAHGRGEARAQRRSEPILTRW